MTSIHEFIFPFHIFKQKTLNLLQTKDPSLFSKVQMSDHLMRSFVSHSIKIVEHKASSMHIQTTTDKDSVLKFILTILGESLSAILLEFNRKLIILNQEIENTPTDGTCAICLNDECDSRFVCCKGSIHSKCFESCMVTNMSNCPYCRCKFI